MTRWIIGSSMKLRLIVVVAAALMMVFGITQLGDLQVDALPEFSRPYVEIQTEALGLSAQEVEAMITTPLEADMLNGTPWVEEIRSTSLPGLSSSVLVFEKGTDLMAARQVVQERLVAVHALPNVSKPPAMLNPISSANRALEIGLTSDELSLIEMSVLARWTIGPRLMGLPGVANVSIWGQRKRQLQVQVEPEKLRDEGVTLMQIIKSAGNALWASPLTFLEASTPGTGGWIDTPNQRLGVRHLLPITTADELAEVTIDGASSKRLGDVATVVEDHQPLIGDAIVNDAPALLLVVEKFPWASTRQVTAEVEESLADLRPGLAGLNMDSTLFRPATFVELALANLTTVALIGAALLILALFALFFDWRRALISTVAIVLSLIAAGMVFYIGGVELNMMILAGLTLALAALIDDAIIDVENIARRRKKGSEEDPQNGMATSIFDAVAEMRRPVVYATLIMALAVVPLLFLEGVSGAFFQPLAYSFILALLASMVVAMTVTPVLSLLLPSEAPSGASPITGMLRGIGQSISASATSMARPVFGAVFVVAIIGLFSFLYVRQESLLPEFKETDVVVRWEGNSGASHPAMGRITRLATAELRTVPGVRNVSAHVGRAIMSDRRSSVDAGELRVSIDPAADYDATLASVREVVAGYPGLSREVLTYLQSQVRQELSGTAASLVVRVYGEDLEIMREKANQVAELLRGIEGVDSADVQFPREMPSLEIEVDLERAKVHGLSPGEVRRAATSLVSGIEVGSLFEEQKVFDVMVYGSPDTRHSLTSIKELLIDTPGGGHVRLEDVAQVRIVPTVTAIDRDSVSRRVDVTANVRGRDVAAVAADVTGGIRQMDFPLEYRAELLGEYAERLAAGERVRSFGIAAAIGIFLLLQAFFRSWKLAAAVFLTLPMALVGGMVTAVLTGGGVVSLGSMLGFVALLGIAVRHAVSLVSRYRDLETEGGSADAETALRGTGDRVAPILMTTMTTALALLPLLLFGDVAGLEILHPMAIVILGGLVTTTLYGLVAVPVTYLLFGADREPELELGAHAIGTDMDNTAIPSGAASAGS